jgi:hypothetical protein
MKKETAIKLFESKQVRTLRSDEEEKWYFSIVDYDRKIKTSAENQTIGIILRKEGNRAVIEFTLPETDQLFSEASIS